MGKHKVTADPYPIVFLPKWFAVLHQQRHWRSLQKTLLIHEKSPVNFTVQINTDRAEIQRLEVTHRSHRTHLVPCNIFLFLNAKDLHRGTDFESSDDLYIWPQNHTSSRLADQLSEVYSQDGTLHRVSGGVS